MSTRHRLSGARRSHRAISPEWAGDDLRRSCRNNPAHRRQRISKARLDRRDDEIDGQVLPAASCRRHARASPSTTAGRLKMLLGAHGSGFARRRWKIRQHARHDGAHQQAAGQTGTTASKPGEDGFMVNSDSTGQEFVGERADDAETFTVRSCRSSGRNGGWSQRSAPAARLAVHGGIAGRLVVQTGPIRNSGSSIAPIRRSRSGRRACFRRSRRQIPVHGRLRIYGRRDQLHGRFAAAGGGRFSVVRPALSHGAISPDFRRGRFARRPARKYVARLHLNQGIWNPEGQRRMISA